MSANLATSLCTAPALGNYNAIYKSVPLPHSLATRFLEVECAETTNGDDTISCRLQTIDLNPQPVFHAVSYVWGEPDQSNAYVVSINGTLVAVRPSLWRLLDQMRKEHFHGLLWIDAICINQTDVAERSQQVSIMGKIYAKATEVHVWLGAHDDHIQLAMQKICTHIPEDYYKTHEIDSSREEKSLGEDEETVDSTIIIKSTRLSQSMHSKMPHFGKQVLAYEVRFSQDDLILMSEIWTCEYWTRLWVVPEFVLAEKLTIRCGSDQMHGTFLESFVTVMEEWRSRNYRAKQRGQKDRTWYRSEEIFNRPNKIGINIVKGRLNWWGHRKDWQIFDSCGFANILTSLGKGNCANEHDRIYAFLPFDNCIAAFVSPDYTKPITQVFVKLCDATMTDYKRDPSTTHRVSLSRKLREVAVMLGVDPQCEEVDSAFRNLDHTIEGDTDTKEHLARYPFWRERLFVCKMPQGLLYLCFDRFPPESDDDDTAA